MKSNIIFTLLMAAVLTGSISSCSTSEGKGQGNQNQSEEIIPVKAESVEVKSISIPINTVGTVSSQLESSLSFKTNGIVRKIYVNNGKKVRKGDLLAELDLVEIRSSYSKAQAAYEKAERELARMKNLYNEKVVTLESYENAQTAFDISKSDLDIVKFNLDYSKIKAPSNGVILGKLAEEGEVVSAGQGIFEFGGTSQNWVIKAGLVDKEIVRVNAGDHAKVDFDAYPGNDFTGYVSKIAGAPDAITGTYEIEISLNEIPRNLKKGFVAKATLTPSEVQEYKLIPIEAIAEAEEEEGLIYTIRNDRPVKQIVKIETIINDQVLILGDISSEDRVITEGVSEINEESIIRIL